MKATVHEGNWLSYVYVEPDGYDRDGSYPLVILLHGFGANMYDLAGICPAIDAEAYVYALPNAPYAVDFGGGALGFSWSQGRPGMAPTTAAVSDGPSPDERLEGFLAEVMERARTAAGRVVLGGFSQGGGVALRFGLSRPGVFAGLAVLSGAARDFDGLRAGLPPERTQPLFIAHGLFDPMVPVERGKATRAFLEECGYQPLYKEYEMAHEISEEVLFDLAPWIRRVLPPAGAA